MNNAIDQTNMQTAELLRLCIAGDENAWQELFEIYGRLIYAIPARFGFSPSECDEVFQEVSLAIINGIASIRQPERLPAWVTTITRRTCIRKFQQQTKSKDISFEEWETANVLSINDDLLFHMQHAEERAMLYRAINKLGVECQQLLTELFLSDEEWSYAEISAKLNIPVGSIGPTRQRCIESLRKSLAQMHNPEPS